MHAPGLDIKQEIARINNNVNIAMFGTGLRKQRITLADDKVVITADHKRIPALAVLDQKERILTRLIDAAILDEYKRRLRAEITDQLGFTVVSVLKDYDPEREIAVTVIILDEGCIKGTRCAKNI